MQFHADSRACSCITTTTTIEPKLPIDLAHMPPKRKSDAFDDEDFAEGSGERDASPPPAKKTKTTPAKGKKGAAGRPTDDEGRPLSWHEIRLEGEDENGEDDVPIYDDCNDIRRKINALLKEPGFKVTSWLAEIGDVNSNSYRRFMKQSGPYGGSTNGTYYCAYKYFEKRRIAEGKKKTPKRLRMEQAESGGVDTTRRQTGVWTFVGK
ncbi:hypothetical protein CYLTODRAFT_426958 [Cylindrobasidium torrendii FP15055 ss-10]|uniref:DUF7726 domain-containing protein n=1 Tax=Cylindrobasidium torrendii FP15055 ss-10 TaxID=1314674 RepID=A0A0D7AVH4_9AGAR|nr:hypothetical protein CYLTODRAFT_426958 [Cylindrobasidium torrendii FP15055 ss-10]